jgi:UDP-N-acetylmuramoyl-L-alanyl-D-glutamate--2,6-diaminopimelate ligase
MLLGELATANMMLPDGAGEVEITAISADSRAVGRGALFAALSGSTTDGARYVADAVARGAAAVLVASDAEIGEDVGVPVLRADDPRLALSQVAARFYPRQPEKLVAVTGTSGKTSVADFARQLFEAAGKSAASVGTLGVVSRDWTEYGSLTTPDPVALHAMLDRLAGAGVTHAAIEASSHGLDQRRLDGLRIGAAGFTNLGRDHMDYHPTVEDYLGAKLRLFSAILPHGGTAVVDMDNDYSEAVALTAASRGAKLIRTGRKGKDIRLVDLAADGFRQRLRVEAFGRIRDIVLPLAGAFQASNALVAAGLVVGTGIDPAVAFAAIQHLAGAPGRIELAGRKGNGAMVFVDYAHKPDALESMLNALRPMTKGRLVVVFGAGGDRDRGKRPLMGEVAARLADIVIVTDDNPRSEDPATIRKAILDAAPGAQEIGDRAAAIAAAIAMLEPGDVLCIAGKGHETGQIVGASKLEFSDHDIARKFLATEDAA